MSASHAPCVRPIATVSFLLIVACIGPAVRPVPAQSLADVARKEEARRKTIPEAAKVYTNKDLNVQAGDSAPPPVVAPAKAGVPSPAVAPAKAGAPPPDAEKDAKDTKEPTKDQAYWSGRLKKLQDQVQLDEVSFQATQASINSLTADFVTHADPAQRMAIESDRQKALAEFSKLKQSITNGKQSLIDLEEEARRAGVPPGWVR
jgi:hypothetical protein